MTQLQSPKRKGKIRRTYRKASSFLYINRGEWRICIERRWLGVWNMKEMLDPDIEDNKSLMKLNGLSPF
jgi:hypothetical protein